MDAASTDFEPVASDYEAFSGYKGPGSRNSLIGAPSARLGKAFCDRGLLPRYGPLCCVCMLAILSRSIGVVLGLGFGPPFGRLPRIVISWRATCFHHSPQT